MFLSWSVNGAGRPPLLQEGYLNQMAKIDAIRQTPSVFVAVGVGISKTDDEILTKPTAWGAKLLRSTQGKAWHRRTAQNKDESSYTEASLVDFSLCRESKWFLGWHGSTFAQMLANYQKLDHNRGFYSVCPDGISYGPRWLWCNETGVFGKHDPSWFNVTRGSSFKAQFPTHFHAAGPPEEDVADEDV